MSPQRVLCKMTRCVRRLRWQAQALSTRAPRFSQLYKALGVIGADSVVDHSIKPLINGPDSRVSINRSRWVKRRSDWGRFGRLFETFAARLASGAPSHLAPAVLAIKVTHVISSTRLCASQHRLF